MFKSKRDVDRHVTHVTNRIRDIKERHARGFQFARLYYDVSDYESGKRYLQEFLKIRETVPQAHKLMGQICEALHDKKTALDSYKRSLDLDPDQTELVLKVCELYCDPSVQINPDNAKLWVERAEKHYPGHYTIFRLKERVIDKDNEGDPGELESLINTELTRNPEDVKLHIRLLKLYIHSREVNKAFEHAVKTEKKHTFVSCMDWYECLFDIYQVYQDQHGCGGDTVFYTYKLFAGFMLTSLRLQQDDRDMLSAIKSLNQFDRDLSDALAIGKKSTEWDSFVTEIKGQLFFLTALLLLKRAQKGQLSWKEASSFGAVCFLLSSSLPTIDQKSSWFCQLSQERRRLYDLLQMLGCDRLSQGGHIIHSLVNRQEGNQWARKLQQKICTTQGCETLYNIVFTDGEMRKKKDNSFLLKNKMFTESSLDVPAKSSLLKYDAVAFTYHTDSLNHLVWLALRYHSCKDDVQQDYEQLFQHQFFPNMKFGMQDLSGGDPGTLCQLDVQVFLYVCVRWVAMQQREDKRNLHPIPDKPDLMPVCMSNNICTGQQAEWWTAMCKLQTNSANEKLAKLFGTVSRGLETLRLVTPHTMPLPIIVNVARTLDKKVEDMESHDTEGLVSPKLNAVQQRAAFYWKCADEMLERIDRNFTIKQQKDMLFPSPVSIMDPAQIKEMREQIRFARACVAMKEERYEEALSSFENLPQAKAAYYTGMVYRKLYESLDINTNSAVGGTNSQQMALLSKAKTSLYQALDRLESENNEDLKETVKEELDGIVCKLISLESGGAVVDSFLSNQSQAYSTAESDVSEEEPLKQPKTPIQSTPHKSFSNVYTNPSPTRIEVQFRALESSNAAFSSRLSTLEETVQTNRKLILELFTQLRESRDENRSLREQIQILSFQGLSNMNMSIQRPSLGQTFPGTPHQRSMLNVMNNSFGAAPPTYDYPVPTGIPPHLSQYGYTGGSPRPGSAYGQPNFEDELNNIDGEFYDPDTEGECYIPDQNLVQEWPFGHKTGVEGKSTITYSPQHVSKGLGPTSPGVFANALRGQSIQYGAYQQPLQPAAAQMPGPGYFSQNNQQMVPPVIPTQSNIYPNTNQMGMMMNASGASSLPASLSPKVPAVGVPRPATTTMMPPNAVMSSTVEAKPKLIPGSVGIPPPNSQTVPTSQPVIPAQPVLSSAATGDQKGKTLATMQGAGVTSSSTSGQATPISFVSSAPGLPGQTTPGSAASMLSQLAGKQQQQVSQAQATPQKTVFKGFSFTSTPKITEPKSDNTEKENISKTTAAETPKPFSGFSFTVAKSSAPASATTTPVTSVSSNTPRTQSSGQAETGAGVIFGKNASPATFGSLSAQGAVASAFKGTQDGVFGGAGLPVFGKSPSPRCRDPSAGSDDNVEEYEPTVDFKPVVPLPELIEVKTGEEDEEKLFVDRAKLFRFDTDTNQWKERGIGEMKILKHKEKVQYRLLMRRDQVLKLCANHLINTDMKLAPMASSDKAWVWSAADFSEGEMRQENLAAKFKTADKAAEFKTVFEKCQDKLKKLAESKSDDLKKESEATKGKVDLKDKGASSSQDGKESLTSLFKLKPGTWTCDGCFVQNGPEIIKCPCCGTIQPGATPEQIKAETDTPSQAGAMAGFRFGSLSTGQSGSGFKFGTQALTSLSNSGTGVFSETNVANKPSMSQSTFKFGSLTSSASTPDSSKSLESSKPTAEESSDVTKDQKNVSEVLKPTAGGFKFGTQALTSLSNSGTGVFSETNVANKPSMSQGTFKFGSLTSSASTPDSSKSLESSKPTAEESSDVTKDQKNVSEVLKPTAGGFKFGSSSMQETPAVAGFRFGSSGGGTSFTSSTEPKTGFVFGSLSTTKPQGSGFLFGVQPSTTSASSFTTSSSQPLVVQPTTTTPIQTTSTNAGSASFNVNKNETKYTFGTAGMSSGTAPQGDSLSSGRSLLAKYLTSPDSWTCYKCGAKLEGLVDVCTLCNVTREESLDKEAAMKSGSASKSSSFAVTNKGTSLFNIGKYADESDKNTAQKGFNFKQDSPSAVSPSKPPSEGFKFSFPSFSDVKKTQPPAEVGSGFNFSLSLSRSVTDTTPTKTAVQTSSIKSPKSPDVSEEGYYVNKEGDDSHIYFEPVVPLPPKVEIKHGEEDEEVVFTHRAKLYRFVKGEWKERGLGNVKVLFNAESKKARLVMRREAILKLCCNHYITSDINFKPMPNSNSCALIWYAMDFSEGEAKAEQFSIKFKSADIVSKFEAAIQDVKDRLKDSSAHKEGLDKKTVDIETMGGKETFDPDNLKGFVGAGGDQDVIILKVETATEEQIKLARELQLPDHFYLYENLPDCPGCRGCDENWSYEAELAQYDDGDEEAEEDDEDYDSDEYEDYDEEDEEEEEEGDNEGENVKSGSDYLYHLLNSGPGEDTGFIFGTATGGISTFASLAKTSLNQAFGTDNTKPFQWEGAGKPLFGAGAGGDEDSDGEGEVQQGDDPQFAPVVPLPELVEVKTGEEDETAVFSQRAKLFRFDKATNQWKEKGIGDMKILKHTETGKYRLLLRREQVHKLACNHLLTPDLVFRPLNTSETSWCWTTTDFSESEGKVEKLALKFKNIDLAKAFKDKVDAIQAELSQRT